jgi:hypothetical protein
MAKQCFVVQAHHNRTLEVFDADTQDGRQKMLKWVEERTGGPFTLEEKATASRVMEGDFTKFDEVPYGLRSIRFAGKTLYNNDSIVFIAAHL